jgi:hypothetical protein
MNILAANELLADLALLPDAERKQAGALLERLSTLMDKARKTGQLSYDTDGIVGGVPVSLPIDASITLTAKQSEIGKLAPMITKELGIKPPELNDLAFIEKIVPDFVKWLQQDKQHAGLLVAEPALAFQAFARDKGVTPPDSLLKHLTAITEQACKMTGTGVRLNSVTVSTSF